MRVIGKQAMACFISGDRQNPSTVTWLKASVNRHLAQGTRGNESLPARYRVHGVCVVVANGRPGAGGREVSAQTVSYGRLLAILERGEPVPVPTRQDSHLVADALADQAPQAELPDQ